jgi:homogentisate 1,2-dioxygenase
MPFYVQSGKVPPQRHTQLRNNEDQLMHEELISRYGFSDIYSNVYHLSPPTRITHVGGYEPFQIATSRDERLRHHHWLTAQLPVNESEVFSRHYLAFNSDVRVAIAKPKKSSPFFYRNARADEVIFIQTGSGKLQTMFGHLDFVQGDYLVVPRGVLYQLDFANENNYHLVIETAGPLNPPAHFLNRFGQFLESAPYAERDLRPPLFTPASTIQQESERAYRLLINNWQGLQTLYMDRHPFDLVAWDGYYYPYAFNIRNYMPRVGKVHLPPPEHLTFTAPGLVICSFVPRLFDFHEKAIPAPYNHSNVDSDEILFYVEGDFMSRKGISPGSITLHPMGLSHGPQPGKYEASIGKKETHEYAVMLDTFQPLQRTALSDTIEDPHYPMSWYPEAQQEK